MSVRPSLNRRTISKQSDPTLLPASSPTSTENEPARRPRSTVGGISASLAAREAGRVAWLEPEAIKQLNMYTIQHDKNVQDLLVEAINDWFARKGLPRFDAIG